MSWLICKLVGPKRGYLQGYINNDRLIFMMPILDQGLEKDEVITEVLIHHMETNTAVMQRCNNKLKELLKELKGESKWLKYKRKSISGQSKVMTVLLRN